MSAVRLVVADGHQLVLEGIQALMHGPPVFSVVDAVADGPTALRRVREHTPDILLIEMQLPGMSSIEICRVISRDRIGTSVVILTSQQNPAYIREAINAGAKGYLSKERSAEEIRRCLRIVHEGGMVCPAIATSFLPGGPPHQASYSDPISQLTSREREILLLLAQDFDTASIASFLLISPRTVRNYLSRIYGKLGTCNRLRTIHFAKSQLEELRPQFTRRIAPSPSQSRA
ncbi:response regulator [Streptomyces sp. NPDC019443]|uniref:response regulator n=1 Tax=Streptomyces sp. NPDC019443 TaxID=3365061 RepID=UPI00379A1CD1